MSQYAQRYHFIEYTGSNSSAIMDFLEGTGGDPEGGMVLISEVNDVLTIEYQNISGPQYQEVINVGDMLGKWYTQDESIIYMTGVRNPALFLNSFVEVPTIAEFDALVQRVEQLENPTP